MPSVIESRHQCLARLLLGSPDLLQRNGLRVQLGQPRQQPEVGLRALFDRSADAVDVDRRHRKAHPATVAGAASQALSAFARFSSRVARNSSVVW